MQKDKNMPLDSWLIQESLKKIAKGPEALMEWAKEHHEYIDIKFMNMLDKIEEYSQKSNPKMAKLISFLKTCFHKMFDFSEEAIIVVSEQNFENIWKKANLLSQQGKAKSALKVLQSISIFLAHHPSTERQALLHANMGTAYAQLKKNKRAIVHFREALKLMPTKGPAQGKIHANLATVYREESNFDAAFKNYRTALQIAKNTKDIHLQICYFENLSLVSLDKKILPDAIHYQRQARKLAEKIGNRMLKQDTMTRLALLLQMSGEIEECQKLCQEALQLSTE